MSKEKEEIRIEELKEKIDDVASRYEDKYKAKNYSLLLEEARREAEEARREAEEAHKELERARQEALRTKEEVMRERTRLKSVKRVPNREEWRKPRIRIANTEWGTFFNIEQVPS